MASTLGLEPDRALHRAITTSCLAGLPVDLLDDLSVGARRVGIEADSIVRTGSAVAPHFDLIVNGMVRVHVSAQRSKGPRRLTWPR